MKTRKLIGTSAALLFVALATGCAFTLQTVVIEPTVEVPPGNIGEGIDISVYVVDERSTSAFGRRGSGAMRGAAITSEQDIAAVFQTTIADLNGVLKWRNGCGAEIHIDVNEHLVFDTDWVTELTTPEGQTHGFAIFPAIDCDGDDSDSDSDSDSD